MALLQDLIRQIEDPVLRDRISAETDRLLKQKKFGLVFEEHLPECTPLYEVPVRIGGMVAKKTGYVSEIYFVTKIEDGAAFCVNRETREESVIPLDELVTIAQFGEPIYPYLKPIDTVCNAHESELWHTLIEADNYHALQLLEYLYAGKVDCIYIDPPYNTGAKDWKYNNDYVDGSDTYRHSKWLSMMEKRLKLAKKLLNPADAVLIVTIDEKEYLHLGCLLEELFPAARMQMITSMINKKGSTRVGSFCRRDEYIYVLFFGSSKVIRTNDDMISTTETQSTKAIWNSLLRRGAAGSSREENANLFYPFFIDGKGKIVEVGEPIPLGVARSTVVAPDGLRAGWPIRSDRSEGRWQVSAENARMMVKNGTMKSGRYVEATQGIAINYLKKGQLEDIENGSLLRIGTDENGAGIFEYSTEAGIHSEPGTIWVRDSHDASIYGSTLLRGILPGRKFPFPKSLYAVQDILRFFVAEKPNALIIDFFAGSGTTLHAVNLLNAEDGGNRRCIMVTNNEVFADEAKALIKQGFKPGDPEWECLGIAHYITWERTRCSIEGHDVNGQPLKGNYIGSDLPMADGFKANAAFFKLEFLDKTRVALGVQFKELLPVLWMKANAVGACPTLEGDVLPDMLVLPQNHFAVLLEEPSFKKFSEELAKHPEIDTVFIVTDSVNAYREMIRSMDGKETYQLYCDYLDNFRINTGR